MSAKLTPMEKHRNRVKRAICPFVPEGLNAIYMLGVGPKGTDWQFLADRYPNASLYGCEPHPNVYASLAPVWPGKIWNVAITPYDGIFPIFLSPADDPHGRSNLIGRYDLEDYTNKSLTAGVPLDQFDSWAGKPSSILLWMDIEGSELAALKSAPLLMGSGRVKVINLEVHGKLPCPSWPTEKQLDEELRRYGYKRAKKYNFQKTHWDAIYTLGETA